MIQIQVETVKRVARPAAIVVAPVHSIKKGFGSALPAFSSITAPHREAKVQKEANFTLSMPLMNEHLGPRRLSTQSASVWQAKAMFEKSMPPGEAGVVSAAGGVAGAGSPIFLQINSVAVAH